MLRRPPPQRVTSFYTSTFPEVRNAASRGRCLVEQTVFWYWLFALLRVFFRFHAWAQTGGRGVLMGGLPPKLSSSLRNRNEKKGRRSSYGPPAAGGAGGKNAETYQETKRKKNAPGRPRWRLMGRRAVPVDHKTLDDYGGRDGGAGR